MKPIRLVVEGLRDPRDSYDPRIREGLPAPEGEPSVCLAGNPTVEGWPCGDPDCVCCGDGE